MIFIYNFFIIYFMFYFEIYLYDYSKYHYILLKIYSLIIQVENYFAYYLIIKFNMKEATNFNFHQFLFIVIQHLKIMYCFQFNLMYFLIVNLKRFFYRFIMMMIIILSFIHIILNFNVYLHYPILIILTFPLKIQCYHFFITIIIVEKTVIKNMIFI